MMMIRMTVRMTCWSESMLIRQHANQRVCSSESMLIKEHAYQSVCSSECVLIRVCAHQSVCSSECVLIRECTNQRACSHQRLCSSEKALISEMLIKDYSSTGFLIRDHTHQVMLSELLNTLSCLATNISVFLFSWMPFFGLRKSREFRESKTTLQKVVIPFDYSWKILIV